MDSIGTLNEPSCSDVAAAAAVVVALTPDEMKMLFMWSTCVQETFMGRPIILLSCWMEFGFGATLVLC